MSAADALAQPRLHDQLIPNEVAFEEGYDAGGGGIYAGEGACC